MEFILYYIKGMIKNISNNATLTLVLINPDTQTAKLGGRHDSI